jgi:beta-glucosidase
MNRQFIEPAIHGRYPDELRTIFGLAWPDWSARDVEALKVPIDYIGLNYYTRSVVRHDPAAWPVPASAVRQPGATYTETGWEMHPQGLTEALLWLHRDYGGLPLYVTENGAALADPPAAIGGQVEDPLRIHYLRTHIAAVRSAIEQGADVRGYCAWSLLDNLEWAHGFSKRFGLVHVDFQSLTRTPKASAHWYARVVASHGSALGEGPYGRLGG